MFLIATKQTGGRLWRFQRERRDVLDPECEALGTVGHQVFATAPRGKQQCEARLGDGRLKRHVRPRKN